MAIPVYVQPVTTYPGRTEWSDSDGYVAGDRVYTSDSISNYSVYVCIQDHSASQQPDVTPNYWRAAGSREYPFLTGSDSNIYTSGYNATEFCLRNTNGFDSNWDPARYLSISDGSERAHVILMDGIFETSGTGSPYMDLSNTDLYAENFQKSWFIFTYYDDASTAENCPTFNNLKIGLHNRNISFDSHIVLNSCLVSDSSPYSTRISLKATHRFQNSKLTQAKDCLFDFSMCANNNFMDKPSISSTLGRSFLKNTTIIFGKQEGQYGGLFYQSGNLIVDKCIFYIKLTDMRIWVPNTSETVLQSHSQPRVGLQGPQMSNSCVFSPIITKTDASSPYDTQGIIQDTDVYRGGNEGIDDSNLINVDPQFIDLENRDYRLRPNSPLIGGTSSSDKRFKIENEYPQGKWFDSSAADGGDGTWDNPYNNYGKAINSFTGDEAVVLIKEGQHQLFSGCPDSSGNFSYTNDLSKVYSNGIKFIGMGSGSVFDTSSSGIKNYGAFWSSANSIPNSRDTPFLFKDFDILLNNSGFINRGMICCRRAEYINVNVTQALNLGGINSNLFDYTTKSGNGNSGEYLKMSNCTINVSISNTTSNTSFLAGNHEGLKQYSGCTFVDLNRTTSLLDIGSPYGFIHQNFGSYAGSYIKDCIFYSKTPNTINFGTNSTQVAVQGSENLEIKNCAVFSTQGSVSIGSNYGDDIEELDPKFVATEPHDFDLRLRPDSPLIGSLNKSKYSADTIWVNSNGTGTGTGTESNPFHFNGDANSQFLDAVNAAVSNGTFEVVFKDGNYRMTTAGEQLRVPNLGLVTLVAENKDQAILSGQRGINLAALTSQTLKLKGFKFTITGNEHFIHTQSVFRPFHLHLDNCYLLSGSQMALPSGSSITAKNSIIDKELGSNTWVYSGSGSTCSFTSCLFIDRNLNSTWRFNHDVFAENHVFKNCIFRSEKSNNSNPPVYGRLIACAVYNYDASSYSDEEVIFYGDPLMIYFDPTSHENSNYQLRPLSPLIGKGK